MKVTPVKKQVITEQITQQIQQMVEKGELQPGDKLPSERELCEQFGASRTAVREAVSALASKGILERRGKGIYVCKLDARILAESMEFLVNAKDISINDIMEARALIEVGIAGLAALRATDEDIAALQETVDNLVGDEAKEAKIRNSAADFHSRLAKATHNPLLADYFIVLYEIFYHDKRSLSAISQSAATHKDILDKVKQHDPEGAQEEMRKHLSMIKESY